MTDKPLSKTELEAWLQFRFTAEETSLRVSRALLRETGLSGGQFGILNNLELQGGSVRQQTLADLMRWDRTRLSHQLTRMTGSGLVSRESQPPNGTVVSITATGRSELARIKPSLADAVRTHFFSRLTKEQLRQLRELAEVLRD